MRMAMATILAVLAHGAIAGYFSDTSAPCKNRVLVGFGLRQEGLGLTWQRALNDGLGWEAGTGFGLTDGAHLMLGASRTWRSQARLRPRVGAGLMAASGFSLNNIHMTIDETDTSTFSYRTKPSLSAYLAGGLQWRLFWKLGLELEAGYAQALLGGGHTVTSTGDEAPVRDYLKATTGSGLVLGSRLFVEF